jgi:hypothetical protein
VLRNLIIASDEGRLTRQLTLKHARFNWDDDDFDVLADGAVIGRIYNSAASPVGSAMDVDAGL